MIAHASLIGFMYMSPGKRKKKKKKQPKKNKNTTTTKKQKRKVGYIQCNSLRLR